MRVSQQPRIAAAGRSRKQVEDGAYAIVGSPETVRDRLKEHIKKLGVGNLLGLFQLGDLPADLTKKSMTMFAQEVLPALRRDLEPAAVGAELGRGASALEVELPALAAEAVARSTLADRRRGRQTVPKRRTALGTSRSKSCVAPGRMVRFHSMASTTGFTT